MFATPDNQINTDRDCGSGESVWQHNTGAFLLHRNHVAWLDRNRVVWQRSTLPQADSRGLGRDNNLGRDNKFWQPAGKSSQVRADTLFSSPCTKLGEYNIDRRHQRIAGILLPLPERTKPEGGRLSCNTSAGTDHCNRPIEPKPNSQTGKHKLPNIEAEPFENLLV